MDAMQARLRGSMVIKHADRSTKGIPDVSWSALGRTCWIENKYLRKGEYLKDILDQQQLVICHQLMTTTNRCWVLIYGVDPARIEIWEPRALAHVAWPRVVVWAQAPGPLRTIEGHNHADAVEWILQRGFTS